MKKMILILFAIVIIFVSIIGTRYYSYIVERTGVIKENANYEEYKDKEIYGIDLATLINKVIDQNEKNKIEKNDKQIYIPNEENSIQIEIYMQDNETTYKMETIYNMGTEEFVLYYGNIKFKCSNIEYHKKTGRIKHVLFEQL